MARPSTQRKRGIDRTDGDNRAVPLTSDPTQYLRGVRQGGRATTQFLNNLAKFMGDRGLKEARVEAREAHKEQTAAGVSDALAGTVDEDRLRDQDVYRQSLNATMGATRAHAWGAAVRKDLERNLREHGPDFDQETFFQERLSEFTSQEEYGDPDFSGAANQEIANVQADLATTSESYRAAKELEQAKTAGQELAFAMLQEPDTFDPKVFREGADGIGLFRQEIPEALVRGATAALELAERPEDLAVYEKAMGALTDKEKALFAPQLDQAYEQAKNHVTRATSEYGLAMTRRVTDDFVSLRDRIASGDNVSLEELQRVRDSYPENEFESKYTQLTAFRTSEAARRAKEAEAASSAESAWQSQVDILNDPNFRTAYLGMKSSDRTKFQNEVFEPYFAQESVAILNTANQFDRASTPEEREGLADLMRQQIEGIRPLIDKANTMNYKPRAFDLFDNVNMNAPDFRSRAEVYDQLRAAFGSRFVPSMSAADRADLDSYLKWTKQYGMSHEETIELLSDDDSLPTPSESRTALRRTDAFEDSMSDIRDTLDDPDGLQTGAYDAIEEMAAAYYRRGYSPKEALNSATKAYMDSHEKIGDHWIPNRYIPRGFSQIMPEYLPILRDQLAGNSTSSDVPSMTRAEFSSDETLTLMPVERTRTDGSLAVVAIGTDGTVRHLSFPGEDGEPRGAFVHPAAALHEWGKARGASSAEEASELFEERLREVQHGRAVHSSTNPLDHPWIQNQ